MAKKDITWPSDFGPSYTPWQMLDMGVFMDCHYNAAITDLPAAWYKHKNVIPRSQEPDASDNYFGVKSRQSLKEWQRKGWTDPDYPLGWWGWYVHFFFGRRLGEKDELEIKRWRSFVARHQGQIRANCTLDDKLCRPKQRQALLQWAWDSRVNYTDAQVKRNARKMAQSAKVSLEDTHAMIVSLNW